MCNDLLKQIETIVLKILLLVVIMMITMMMITLTHKDDYIVMVIS